MTYNTLLSTYSGALTDSALNTAASAGVETVTEELSQCFSALIDLCFGDAQSVSAETVGDFKREYRDPTAGRSQLQRAAEVIRQYLGGTDLLFRGTEE